MQSVVICIAPKGLQQVAGRRPTGAPGKGRKNVAP